MLLYDGAIVGASIDRDPSTPGKARAIVEVLLDAVAAPKKGSAAMRPRQKARGKA
jgi:hypothetical protein